MRSHMLFSGCTRPPQALDLNHSYLTHLITQLCVDRARPVPCAVPPLQALDLDGNYLTHLNYAITLYANDEPEKAAEHFSSFKQLFQV